MNHLRRLPRPARRHLPEELNFLKPEEALGWGRGLLESELGEVGCLRDWLEARTEFEAAMEEALLVAKLDFADLPADPQRRSWLDRLRRQSGAPLEELGHRLDEHLWRSPARAQLDVAGRAPWEAALRVRLDLHRESNWALKERLAELEVDYTEILGGLTILRSGRSCPLSEIRYQLLGDDPTTRRSVWEARAARLEELRPVFEDLLDEILALREQIARNADHSTWNSYRAALGQAPALWRPEDLLATAAGRPRAARPWDLGFHPGDGIRLVGAERMLAELVDGLSYHAPILSQTLRRLELTGLLDLQPRSGKFDLDACFWLPERRLPILRLSAHALEDDLGRFLRHLLAAHEGLAASAVGKPPTGTVLFPNAGHIRQAQHIALGLLSEYDRTDRQRMESRLGHLRRLELRQALVQEYWGWWLHENPGAGRVQRRRVWTAALALAFPGAAELDAREELEDTLFLEVAFFLPDWSPPSLASLLQAGGN